jgi:HlyD family secretion protein
MERRRRKQLAVLALVLAAVAVYWSSSRRGRIPSYVTATVDRGDIFETVGATGTLQAVTTVQVGSQVSGTILSLGADFNSVVKRGQVIARLDPSLFEARLGQARANLVAARANVERAQATVTDTRQKYERALSLSAADLMPQSDLETAKANYDGAMAQLRASEAAVGQAEATVNQAQVDLEHTVISTPIDGVVINRAVDVGQTVAASFQAPTLFVIANNLAQMQVNAAVDEADIGRVAEKQEVSFRVDAYPDRIFVGRVAQVRLQPQTIQNVVSYNTIISVDNSEQKLMPGMTATVSIVVRKAERVLRVPAAALRFRPEGFTAEGGSGRRAGTGRAASGGSAAVEAAERPGGSGPRGSPSAAPGGGADAASQGSGASRNGRPSLVFTPRPGGPPQPVRIRTGISDGQFVEVRDGLGDGQAIVTGIQGGTGGPRTSPTPSASVNPFAPGPPARRQR